VPISLFLCININKILNVHKKYEKQKTHANHKHVICFMIALGEKFIAN